MNGKGKQKKNPPVEKEQSYQPSSSRISKKNGKGKTLCSYYGRGFHPESSSMRRTIDEMVVLLEKHNIIVHAGARKAGHREEIEQHDERCHALMASCSTTHAFLIDSGDSNHMVASRESFSSLQSTDGPRIHMGHDSQIRAKWKGSINFEHGKFKDVLYVPSLAANMLFVYHMTHTGPPK